jgi:hypothetical protein
MCSVLVAGGGAVNRRLAALVLLLGLAPGCRIEDHTPAGSRRDEAIVREVVVEFFQARAARDWPGLRELCEPAATLEGNLTPEQYVAQLGALPGGGPPGERTLRADYRQVGDLASAWLVVRPEGGAPMGYYLLLHRSGRTWRIRHLASTTMPSGAEP